MVQDEEKKVQTPIAFITRINDVELWIKRDDLLHREVSGNKWYKLKHHVQRAEKNGFRGIATFGGAFSNHLIATAAYAKMKGLRSLGFVRGEATSLNNPTLKSCTSYGMELVFMSRADYRLKSDRAFLNNLKAQHPLFWFVPEGGGGTDGIKGAKDIYDDRCEEFDALVCAIGTGTTIAGIASASQPYQRIIGIPIHKHERIMDELEEEIDDYSNPTQLEVIQGSDYHFGGYAKWNHALLAFIRKFNHDYNIQLDPIYTGKAMFGLMDMIEHSQFNPGSKLLFIHTGGLQGIAGFEERFDVQLS